jgi:hypothetical protein
MKKTQTYLLLLAVLLAVLGLYFSLSGKKGSLQERHRNFRLYQNAQVVRVEMHQKSGKSIVIKKDSNEIWQVNNNYLANESAVRELLGTMRHLNVRLPVAISEQQNINEALEKNGVLVEVFVKTHWINWPANIKLLPRVKREKRFLVGEDTPDGESTYMRLFSSDMPFAVHVPGQTGGLSRLFSVNENMWRDPVVVNLKPNEIKSIEVVFTDMEQESFVFDWALNNPRLMHNGLIVDSELIDQTRLMRYLESFSQLYFERLLNAYEDSLQMEQMIKPEFLKLTITDQNNRITTLRFFRRKATEEEFKTMDIVGDFDPNRFFLQVNEGDFAQARYFVFGRIMRPLSYFMIPASQ